MEVGGFSRIDGELRPTARIATIRRAKAASLARHWIFDFVPKRDDKAKAEQCILAAVERCADQTAKAHFITYRNNLNKLLATMRCPNDDWCIGVKRLAGDQRWRCACARRRRARG